VKAARELSARLLEVIEPLADSLHPPVPPLETPDVICGPDSLDSGPYLRILRWLFEDGEDLRALGFPEQLDDGPISAIVGGAMGMFAAAMDKTTNRTLVAVTDRRIILAETNTLLEQAEIHHDIPLDQVRYVRAPTAPDGSSRVMIDLITRDENIRWLFQADVDNRQVDALAAVLAESMTIPDAERDELRRRRYGSVETGESAGARSTEPIELEATACDVE
jgi:hypothetical protein